MDRVHETHFCNWCHNIYRKRVPHYYSDLHEPSRHFSAAHDDFSAQKDKQNFNERRSCGINWTSTSFWLDTHICLQSGSSMFPFVDYVKPTEASPVPLLLDGHYSHIKNIELIAKAKENHVTLVSLPPQPIKSNAN